MTARFQFYDDDPDWPVEGWHTWEGERHGDAYRADGARIGVTGAHGRWYGRGPAGALLRGPGGRLRYFTRPSRAARAVDERWPRGETA